MKKYLFNQPAGLGDIMFIMAIAQKYYEEGNVIHWPIDPCYGDYSYNFPEVKFIPQDKFFLYNFYDSKHFIFEDDNYISIPFRWADVIIHGKSVEKTQMFDKYILLGMDPEIWRNIKIVRNIDKENELYKLIGLKEDEEFNLINENQTRIYQKTKIEINNGIRNVYMNAIPGYNMLDWLKIIYKATNIYTVATSILILMDKIIDDLQTKEIHIYKRIWNTPHSEYNYYMKKEKYIWH